MNNPIKDNFRSKLREEAKKLREELLSLGVKDGREAAHEETPSAERLTREEQEDRSEEFEVELSEVAALRTRLQDVEETLSIIDTPEFGICKTCGKPIPEERLEANPAARYDIEHEPTA